MKILYLAAGLFIGYSLATTVFMSSLESIAWTTFLDSLFSGGKNMFGNKYILSNVHYIIFFKIITTMIICGGIGLYAHAKKSDK